jgi:phage gp29-like protein
VADITLFDPWGQPIKMAEKPPKVRLADIGRVRDPFAARTLGEITPELMARVLRGNARLPDVMFVAQKMLDDDHLFATMRRLVFSISRLPIQTEAADDSGEAKKDAVEAKLFLDRLPSRSALVRWTVFGEYYPVAGSETGWNDDYGVDSFYPVDPLRWNWNDIPGPAANSLRLLTADDPYLGVELEENGYVLHSSRLEPGPVRRSGLWRKCAWIWLFKQFSWDELIKFVELYGNPHRWAFYELPEQEESVKAALEEMGANYAGVFPKGVEVKFAEAQRYGTMNLHETIISLCNKAFTKVVNGHDLDAESSPDTGALSGGHASDVQQEIKEGVGEGIGETLREKLLKSWALFNRGRDYVQANRTPHVKLIASKPMDQQVRAQVFISANEALARAGKIVDPIQIEEDLAIRTVDVEPIDPSAAPDNNTNDQQPDGAPLAAKRTVIAAAKPPKIRTAEQVIGALKILAAAENREVTTSLLELLAKADDPKHWGELLLEEYGSYDPAKLAGVLAEGMGVAAAIGQGDGAERRR